MKKIVSFLVVAAFLTIGLSAVTLKVKSSVANVRTLPEGNSQVIVQLKQGVEIEAKAKKGNWYEVEVANAQGQTVTGYIHMSTVEEVGAEAKAEEEKAEPARSSGYSAEGPAAIGGFKIFLNPAMTNMKFSQVIAGGTKKGTIGFGGGIGYEMGLGSMLGLELGAWFSPGGCKITSDTDPTTWWKFSGYAVTVPVLLKVHFTKGTGPTIFAGGQVGYILIHKWVITAGGVETEMDVTDIINKLYYGLVFGAGLEMNMGSMKFVIEGQYHLGLSNLVKDPLPGDTTKTSSINLLLGIKL